MKWLLVLGALAVVGGVVFGMIKLFTSTPNLTKSAVLLPGGDTAGKQVFPWADGVLSITKDRQLICCDMKGVTQWTIQVPADNMKASRRGKLTAVWGGKVVQIIDETGISLVTKNMQGEVIDVAVGETQYAVITKEEDQHRLYLYNLKSDEVVDGDNFPSQSVMGLGFYGKGMENLWTLALDSHGTVPVTRLTTYYPGKLTTGTITLNDEVGYTVVLAGNSIYVVGTHSLTDWQNGEKKSSRLVYGWNLQDSYTFPSGKTGFLFSPSGGQEASTQISMLWYIDSTGTEYRVPLPPGCIKAMIKSSGKLCVATRNGAYLMDLDGTNRRFYPLNFNVDSVPAVVSGSAFVAQSTHRNYLIPMP